MKRAQQQMDGVEQVGEREADHAKGEVGFTGTFGEKVIAQRCECQRDKQERLGSICQYVRHEGRHQEYFCQRARSLQAFCAKAQMQ